MKRSVTLIEMVIAMTLFSALITSLFFWYSHISRKPDTESLLEKRYCLERLSTFFSKATLDSKKGLTTFHTNDNSLIFTFENGAYEEPLLSDIVLARLHHDKVSHLLSLTIWPQPTKDRVLIHPSITFPLLHNVKEIDFNFFYPPNPLSGPVSPHEIKTCHPNSGWQKQWRAEFQALPALIKLTINNIEHIFDFPYPIIYPSEAI